ncbi:MAG: type II toxin-antitoxin system VapC family toxin [Isosphaeraceae bacterium]
MAAFIFDASGIVKRYLNETGSGWIHSLADPAAAHEIFLTRVCKVEVIAAVTRRGRGGSLPTSAATALVAQFRHDAAHQYNILEITPALLTDAERLAEAHGLRAYDAVQLAATIELHHARSTAGLSRVTFISADQELNAAATAEALTVDDPTTHP